MTKAERQPATFQPPHMLSQQVSYTVGLQHMLSGKARAFVQPVRSAISGLLSAAQDGSVMRAVGGV